MSVIVVNYGKLDDAADYAEKGIKHCKKYIDDLEDVEKKLTSKQVTNVEDGGGVSAALNLARRKLDEAKTFQNSFTKCAQAINNAKVTVKEKDMAAASNINTIMNAYLGRRGILSKAKEFMYRQYTCFLDKISGLGELGKNIKKILKNAEVAFDGWVETAKNWFKYGNGKYLANVLDGVKNVVLAAAGLIVAVAAVVTGPVWLTVVGVVGVVASGIYLICQIVDTSIQSEQNSKAIELSKQGNITAARYYGDIDGLGEWTKRRDFGGETANNVVEGYGIFHDGVKAVSKFTSKVCSLVSGFAKLGITTNAQGETIVDWNRAKMGYKYKMFHDGGFNSNDYQTGGFSVKTAFSPESYAKNIFTNKTIKAVSEYGVMAKGFGYVADTLKTWDNIVDIKKGVETLATPDSSLYDKVGAFMDTAGKTPIVDSFGSDLWDLVDGVKKLFTSSASSISVAAPVTVSAAVPATAGSGRF